MRTARPRLLLALALLAAASPAAAANLRLGVLPDQMHDSIDCVWAHDCDGPQEHSATAFTLPGTLGGGELATIVYSGGEAGTPGFGRFGYVYFLDLFNVEGNADACVTHLSVDFGPIAAIDYEGGGPDDLVVVDPLAGGPRPDVVSAEQTAGRVTVRFEPAVCPGQISGFFGMASAGQPVAVGAELTLAAGPSVAVDTVGPVPSGTPSPPTGLVAAPLSETSVQLTWQDHSDDEDAFHVEVRDLLGSFFELGTVPAGVGPTAGTAVGGLAPGNTYIFRVRASSSAGFSGYSNEASATTLGSPGPCVPGATTLCIDDEPGDRRFRVTISYATVQAGGVSGLAGAVPLAPLGITSGGVFYFLNPTNPELLLKVIDACPQAFWVFYSAGTNVGFTVVVTDTVLGRSWTHTNPDLTAAPPVLDTGALPCS